MPTRKTNNKPITLGCLKVLRRFVVKLVVVVLLVPGVAGCNPLLVAGISVLV